MMKGRQQKFCLLQVHFANCLLAVAGRRATVFLYICTNALKQAISCLEPFLNPIEGPFSVFAWIKGGAAGQVIISQADIAEARSIRPGSTWLGMNSSDGGLMTGLTDAYVGALESESVVTDGQWHHTGFVWDGLCRYLYVDGVEVAKDTIALAPLKTSDGGLYIGTGQDLDPTSYWSGLVDDVRIYNVALNAEEIASLAQ